MIQYRAAILTHSHQAGWVTPSSGHTGNQLHQLPASRYSAEWLRIPSRCQLGTAANLANNVDAGISSLWQSAGFFHRNEMHLMVYFEIKTNIFKNLSFKTLPENYSGHTTINLFFKNNFCSFGHFILLNCVQVPKTMEKASNTLWKEKIRTHGCLFKNLISRDGKSHRQMFSLHLLHVAFLNLSFEHRALLLAERSHPRREYSQVKMEVLLFWEKGSKKKFTHCKKREQTSCSLSFSFKETFKPVSKSWRRHFPKAVTRQKLTWNN